MSENDHIRRCTRCDRANPRGRAMCMDCGVRLEEPPKTCPECKEEVPRHHVLCTSCGAEMPRVTALASRPRTARQKLEYLDTQLENAQELVQEFRQSSALLRSELLTHIGGLLVGAAVPIGFLLIVGFDALPKQDPELLAFMGFLLLVGVMGLLRTLQSLRKVSKNRRATFLAREEVLLLGNEREAHILSAKDLEGGLSITEDAGAQGGLSVIDTI